MPKFEDLEFLKQRIVNIGNEIEIKKTRGEDFKDIPIPDKEQDENVLKDTFDGLLSDDLLDDINAESDSSIDDLLAELEPKEAINNAGVDFQMSDDDGISEISDTYEEPEQLSVDETVLPDEPAAEDDGTAELLNSFGADDFGIDEETDIPDADDNSADLSEFLSSMDPGNKPDESAATDDLSDLMGGMETAPDNDVFSETTENTDEIESAGGELSDLFGSLDKTGNQQVLDEFNLDEPTADNEDNHLVVNDSFGDLSSLMELGSQPADDTETDSVIPDLSDLDKLDDGNQENGGGAETQDSILGNIELNEDDSSHSDDVLSDLAGDLGNLDDDQTRPDIDDIENNDSKEEGSFDGGLGDFDLGSLDELAGNKSDSLDNFSLDDLDSLVESPKEDLEELPENIADTLETIHGEEPLSLGNFDEDAPAGDSAVAVENGDDADESKTGDEEDILTDDERRAVILHLSAFPKEVELKLAQVIVNGKYSDDEIMPLVKALIKGEDQHLVAKIYEKITGDTSIQKVEFRKFTGQDFEKKQHSFAYNFEKNILPIITRVAAAAFVIVGILFFVINFVVPSFIVSGYYKTGKDNIRKLDFDNVEPYFSKAFSIQPRYKEVIAYARLYREYARYNDAEKKYQLADEMKEDRDLDLEFADFYREIKRYEVSAARYRDIIKTNLKDIDARNGLGRTYYDWSFEEKDKLINAEEQFLEVLDIDMKNSGAIFGILRTRIKMDDPKKIMDAYKYAELHLKKENVDVEVYCELASYILDKGSVNDVKNILSRASASLKGKDIYPELDYQYARYHKQLTVYDDERKYLESAVKKIEWLKERGMGIARREKGINKLSSKVYNDLGENYDRMSRANIKAENMYNKAIDADPTYAKPYYNLGNFAFINKGKRDEALRNYLLAEERGFLNDTLDYNVGWLQYKAGEFYRSFEKINKLLDMYKDNNNLKFMCGTILFHLGKYDLAESQLRETYEYFDTMRQANYPLDMEIADHKYYVEMLYKSANNLASSLFMKYRQTRKTNYMIEAGKYYAVAIEFYDKYKDPLVADEKEMDAEDAKDAMLDASGGAINEKVALKRKYRKAMPNLNLMMVLYPDTVTLESPGVFEDFNQLEFMK